MGLRERVRGSNALIGILLLVMLAFFIGPNLVPNLLPSLVPFIDEGIDCRNLRSGEDRAQHQSLIGRLASSEEQPLDVSVAIESLPTTDRQSLQIRVILTNRTIGTVPFVWPGDVLVNNANVSGVGIIFNNAPIPPATTQQTFVPDSNIRLLVPRQRCVLYVEIPSANLTGLGVGSNSVVRAFYRNTSRGALEAGTGGGVFVDQGLWVGVAESTNVSLLSVQPSAQ